ncbi:MAG: VWA domain-containing protein [Candidatus Rokubacteria bacterium]|nr:VWA domain-containing protein [Candidatus Rokubacteria bacterium]
MPARALTTAVLSFAALLRRHGLPITVAQVMDAARALDHLDLADRNDVYLGLRAVLVARPEDYATYERCFQAFWRADLDPERGAMGPLVTGPDAAGEESGSPERSAAKRETTALDQWGVEEDESGEPLEVPGVSDHEAVMGQDFSTFTSDQLDEVFRLTIQIARRLARRLTRRRRPIRRRGRVDLRRTLRANLTRADLIELRYRERKRRKVRLVLLCDVSGSMDLYSRFLLQFLFALQHVFGQVETFTFSTRLTRVTEYLKSRNYREVLRRLTDVRDWSGGTRIGESLAQFNRDWPSLVDRRTIVIVLSDGWDTGEPEVLATELLRIKRRAGRVIWLNPLLGNPSYEPLTRGMVAALPLVDHFAAAHNLSALRDLAGKLTL